MTHSPRIIASVAIAAFIVCLFASDIRADLVPPFDPTADYENANPNVNSPWRYGWIDTANLGGIFNLYTNSQELFNLQYWNISSGTVPAVVYNPTNDDITVADSTFVSNELVLHAGVDAASVVRFTSPVAGSFMIDASFSNRTTNFGTRVAIYHNGVSLWDGTTGDALGSIAEPSNPLSLNLAVGHTVDFIVSTRADATFTSTTTQLNALIGASAVPEASSLVLVGVAVAICLVAKRRRIGRQP